MSLGNDLITSGMSAGQAKAVLGAVKGGLVATGASQATALLLSAVINTFATVAAGTGTILPSGANQGDSVVIINDGANDLSVYPPLSGTVGGGATNIPYTVLAGTTTVLWCTGAKLWTVMSGFKGTGGALTGGGAAGQVAFWTNASNLSTSVDLAWDDATKILELGATAKITTPEIQVGASLFSFQEFNGALQLGNACLILDVSSGTDNSLSFSANASQATPLHTWADSAGNPLEQIIPQGAGFVDGISHFWLDPAAAASHITIDHFTAASSQRLSQIYIQRSSTHNAILVCSDDFNSSGKRGSLVDVFAPVAASPTHQMSGSMWCDGVSTVLELTTDATDLTLGYFNVTDGTVTQSGGTLISEIATPATPPDGRGWIYMKDAGAGKTGLYVLFPDGVEQQIKVEP